VRVGMLLLLSALTVIATSTAASAQPTELVWVAQPAARETCFSTGGTPSECTFSQQYIANGVRLGCSRKTTSVCQMQIGPLNPTEPVPIGPPPAQLVLRSPSGIPHDIEMQFRLSVIGRPPLQFLYYTYLLHWRNAEGRSVLVAYCPNDLGPCQGNPAESVLKAKVPSDTVLSLTVALAINPVTPPDPFSEVELALAIEEPNRPLSPPTASFTASPTQPATAQIVMFDGSGSFDPDGSIVQYSWDFGDGFAAEGRTITHSFAVAGEFTASLTVTDNDGFTGTTQRTIVVIAPIIQVRVDVSGDGVVTFADSSDLTSSAVPYRFWVNDDSDATEVPFRRPIARDYADHIIGHIRDLEDFAQLVIRVDSSVTNLVLDGHHLFLETTGGLEVNLFPAVVEGDGYLTNSQVAALQRTQTAVDGASALPFVLTRGAASVEAFLFEGRAPGRGELRVVLRNPQGVEVSHGQVHLELLRIGEMYERAQGTSNDAIEGAGFSLPPPSSETYRARPPVLGYRNDTPGFVTPPGEAHALIVFVHGCCIDRFTYRNVSDTTFKRLWWQGYRGRFASFRWPAIPLVVSIGTGGAFTLRFNEEEFRAWKYGS
jgi:hypothetical protein